MKKLILILGIAIELGGYIFLYDNSTIDVQKQEVDLNIPLYDSFKTKHPHHVIIKQGEEIVDLQREWGGEWQVINAENYPADEEKINQMLEEVLGAKQKQVVSNNPQNWDKFEVVEDKAIEVIFKEREDREIAHFWVGKAGPTFMDQYVRKNNLNEVILVNTNLTSCLTRPINLWKDQTILKMDEDQIKAVKLVSADESENYELVKSASGWTVNGADAEQEKVDVVLQAFSELKTVDFPEDEIEFNLESADYTIEISSTEGGRTFYLQKEEDVADYLLKLAGNQTLFKITEIKKNEFIYEVPEETEE